MLKILVELMVDKVVSNAISTIKDYATTDQEKEGREKGTKGAADIYKPVLEELESRQKEIIKELDEEQKNFKEQATILKKQCVEYEIETAEFEKNLQKQSNKMADELQSFFEGEIKSLQKQSSERERRMAEIISKIRSQGDKQKELALDNFIKASNATGMFNESDDLLNVIANTLYMLMNLNPFGYFLEKKMCEKRDKYYKIEFKKKSLKWQEKIKSVRNKILQSIESWESLTNSNKEQIQYITKIVDDAFNEYCETLAKYNVLREMEK